LIIQRCVLVVGKLAELGECFDGILPSLFLRTAALDDLVFEVLKFEFGEILV
jgi:hypothetical protein